MEIRLLLHLLWQSQVPVLFPVPCLCVSMSPPGGNEETCGQCLCCTRDAGQADPEPQAEVGSELQAEGRVTSGPGHCRSQAT